MRRRRCSRSHPSLFWKTGSLSGSLLGARSAPQEMMTDLSFEKTVKSAVLSKLCTIPHRPQRATQVKINIFEGPLDLLLHLIQKDDLDIYDIPISEITAEYSKYVDLLTDLNLERGRRIFGDGRHFDANQGAHAAAGHSSHGRRRRPRIRARSSCRSCSSTRNSRKRPKSFPAIRTPARQRFLPRRSDLLEGRPDARLIDGRSSWKRSAACWNPPTNRSAKFSSRKFRWECSHPRDSRRALEPAVRAILRFVSRRQPAPRSLVVTFLALLELNPPEASERLADGRVSARFTSHRVQNSEIELLKS